MVIQKAEENNVSERRRKNKKKKEASVPHPACLWVYFSKEFIKEYSASHPESSGLKAATKAASEAWKSMSHEEKETYSRHAREPPGLRCRTLRRSICLWLLERFDTTNHNLEICNKQIPLMPKDVEFVMRLSASGKDVVNSGPDDIIADLRDSYSATNRGISVPSLEEQLAAPEAGDEFKRSFVLYALGTLLATTARLDASSRGIMIPTREAKSFSSFSIIRASLFGELIIWLLLLFHAYFHGARKRLPREKKEKESMVICKERCHNMKSFGYRDEVYGPPISDIGAGVEHHPVLEK
ncbi:E3 ubiquitin-protein ligase SINA-like [Quillaja saponaria]|nr:E3 ubiquitin-protein ligase SINA-like [Quillaja saponaria]